MSHYSEVRTTIKRSKVQCLKRALCTLGFKEHMIEISLDTPLALRGYQGDTRTQQAHVRIKGAGWKDANYVGTASNDLGFEFRDDGSCTFHVSDFDRTRYNQSWQDKLLQEYAKEVVKDMAGRQQFTIEEESRTPQGVITLKVKAPF